MNTTFSVAILCSQLRGPQQCSVPPPPKRVVESVLLGWWSLPEDPLVLQQNELHYLVLVHHVDRHVARLRLWPQEGGSEHDGHALGGHAVGLAVLNHPGGGGGGGAGGAGVNGLTRFLFFFYPVRSQPPGWKLYKLFLKSQPHTSS